MRGVAMAVSGCVLGLSSGSGCGPQSRPDSYQYPPYARSIQLYNCTHDDPPSGRAFEIWGRVDEQGYGYGNWILTGQLDPVLGEWTDCYDTAHEQASITIDLLRPAGKWEIWAI